MSLNARTRHSLKGGAYFILLGVAGGAIFGIAGANSFDLLICIKCLAKGALVGFIIVTPIVLFEVLVLQTERGAALLRLPFAVLAAFRTLFYFAFIAIGLVVDRIWLGGPDSPLWDGLPSDLASAGMGALALNFVLQVNRMLGLGVLGKFVSGRYHRPREEVRVFLFLDLASSTTIAETVGNLRFHRLLDRIFFDLTGPVLEHSGEIYRYVGDQIIVTWPAAVGLKDAACLRCYAAALDKFDAVAGAYELDFGFAPSFHAGLHIGSVVSGEMGDIRREIVYLGDVVNTTARIEELSSEMDLPALASAELMHQLELPDNLAAAALGEVRLRGKAQPVALYSLTRRQPRASEESRRAPGAATGANDL